MEIEGEELFAFPWGVSKDFNNENFRDKIVFAHCTIRSMLANPERRIKGGIDPKYFSLAKQVFCGHIHTTSSLGNIYNLGSSHYLRWQDALHDEKRGGCVLDTETGQMTKIINQFCRFSVVNLVSGQTQVLKKLGKFSAVRVYLPLGSFLDEHRSLSQKLQAASPCDLKIFSSVEDYWRESKRLLHDGFYVSAGTICEYLFSCGVRSYEMEFIHALSDTTKVIIQELMKSLSIICLVRHMPEVLLKSVLARLVRFWSPSILVGCLDFDSFGCS